VRASLAVAWKKPHGKGRRQPRLRAPPGVEALEELHGDAAGRLPAGLPQRQRHAWLAAGAVEAQAHPRRLPPLRPQRALTDWHRRHLRGQICYGLTEPAAACELPSASWLLCLCSVRPCAPLWSATRSRLSPQELWGLSAASQCSFNGL
jgi:hypothetical protein